MRPGLTASTQFVVSVPTENRSILSRSRHCPVTVTPTTGSVMTIPSRPCRELSKCRFRDPSGGASVDLRVSRHV